MVAVKGRFLVPALIAALLLTACGGGANAVAIKSANVNQSSYLYEMAKTELNQEHLDKVQPPTPINSSLERTNIAKRVALWNNPNRVSYIYLMSGYGQIIAFFTIKGKVSSVNSHRTSPTQIIHSPYCSQYNGSNCGMQVPSPSFDGSYGPNGSNGTVFFFTTDGTYVEWSGVYLLSTRPLTLSQPPLVTMTATQAGYVKKSSAPAKAAG